MSWNRLLVLTVSAFWLAGCVGYSAVNQAATALDRKDPNKTIEAATRALNTRGISPHSAALAYVNRSGAYILKAQYDLAIADANSAIALDDKVDSAFADRGVAYLFQMKFDLAIASFNRAIALDRNVDYLVNRGVAYRRSGQIANAIADYDEVLRREPSRADVYDDRAFAYKMDGKYEQSITDYSQALKRQPDNADSYHGRCGAYLRLGRIKEALVDCNRAVAIRPGDTTFLGLRAYASLKAEDYKSVIADCDTAVRLRPSFAGCLFLRGLAKQRSGDGNGAADIAAARQIDPMVSENIDNVETPLQIDVKLDYEFF